jgi:hypothetical protein
MFRSIECDDRIESKGRSTPKSGTKKIKLVILMSACAVALAMATSAARAGRADDRSSAPEAVQQKGDAAQPDRVRFDNKVRESFFSGFAGDAASLDQAMKMCEDALARTRMTLRRWSGTDRDWYSEAARPIERATSHKAANCGNAA